MMKTSKLSKMEMQEFLVAEAFDFVVNEAHVLEVGPFWLHIRMRVQKHGDNTLITLDMLVPFGFLSH